ncbi:hypothetical protein M3J09_001759 [Ascochyta lentis]
MAFRRTSILVFISRSTDYRFTSMLLLVLRCFLSGRYGILRPALSRQWRPRHEWGSTTRAVQVQVDADRRIILQTHPSRCPSRMRKARTQHTPTHTHKVAAREIDIILRYAPRCMPAYRLEHGDALWRCLASGSLPQRARRDASLLLPMGHPVLQGDCFEAALRSESCHRSDNSEPAARAQHKSSTNLTPLADTEFGL